MRTVSILLVFILWLLTVSICLAQRTDFVIVQTLQTDESPYNIFFDDLDGDSDDDLITCNYGGGSISVSINTDGVFAPVVSTDIAPMLRGLAIADFNNDKILDIATANGNNSISVLFGDGVGNFNNQVDYSAGNVPHAICIGDFNRDDKIDVACANAFSNDISIFINNGDSTFSDQLTFGTSQHPRGIFSVDLNRDGWDDIATGNRDVADMSVLINDLSGGFLGNVNYVTGKGTRYITGANLDNKFLIDLITVNSESDNLSIFFSNNDNPFSEGTFEPAVNISVPGGPYWVTPFDIDLDSDQDLITANTLSNTISVIINDGKGGFSLTKSMETGEGPISVASAIDQKASIWIATADYFGNTITILRSDACADRDTCNCCGLFTGGYAGNVDCSTDGIVGLGDITKLIDYLYISNSPLCCEANANLNGDRKNKITLVDLIFLFKQIYGEKPHGKPLTKCK